MRTVFVTGGTGTIGSRLLGELHGDVRSGRLDVRAGVRSTAAAAALAAKGVAAVPFDFADRSTFARALDGAAALFLLRPYGMEAFIQSRQLIDAARDAGVTQVVHVSAHGAPWAATIGWIHLVDAYIERSGMACTLLRPGFFMDNVLAAADPRTATVRHFFGHGRVGWIAAADIAAVAAAALRRPEAHAGRVYPLASEARSMDEIAALIAELTGRPWRYLAASTDEQAVAAFVARGRGEYFSREFISYMRAIAEDQVPEAAETFDNVATITGRPPLSWRDFLAAQAGRLTNTAA